VLGASLPCTVPRLGCQRKDWKQQHKKICKLLNVGHGDMQVRTDYHMTVSITLKEHFKKKKQLLNDGVKRFFKLFQESTFEGSRATAQSMTKFAKRQTKRDKKGMLYHSLCSLIQLGDAFVAKQSTSCDASVRRSQ
jgi:hypothetical protein